MKRSFEIREVNGYYMIKEVKFWLFYKLVKDGETGNPKTFFDYIDAFKYICSICEEFRIKIFIKYDEDTTFNTK